VRLPLLSASLLGLTAVILGAFGAHALAARLAAAGMKEVWETAVHFQLFHAATLVGIAALARGATPPLASRLRASAILLTAGTVCFSGSLYGLALGGPRLLGPVTPLGGLCLILGWLCLLWAALTLRE
jgi:uncharacterized membrane protein YgdD (TMEM256/DUF423 family)